MTILLAYRSAGARGRSSRLGKLPSLLACALLACGDASVHVGDASSGASARDAATAGRDAAAAARDAGRASAARDAGTDDPEPAAEVESCAGIEAEADARLLPVDIIWAIDGSGSMVPSFPAIQAALNKFSGDVEAAGIDAHIVLLTSQALCVPAPLGSGKCGAAGLPLGPGLPGAGAPASAPDSNPPRLLHLDVSFGYGEGMPVLLNNFVHFKQALRADARTQLVLTEDGAPPMSAQAVIDHIEGRTSATGTPAWSPGLVADSWIFSGVICKNGLGGGACLTAFLLPETTSALIELSGGVSEDLSLAGQQGSDPFAGLLQELAAKVIVGAELSCEYDIPEVPAGQTFDRGLVNVLYGTGGSDKEVFPYAEDACRDAVAWHYDDNDAPTKILLCPKACERARTSEDGKLEVKFGCQTTLLL